MENSDWLYVNDFNVSGTFAEDLKPLPIREVYSMFTKCLGTYLKRQLTYPSDALNAFAGISRILESRLPTPMLFGLPVAFFDSALLCWGSFRGTMQRRSGFPSWSWAGWCGSMSSNDNSDPFEDIIFLEFHTWIEWYVYSEEKDQFISLRSILSEGHQPPEVMSHAYHNRFIRMGAFEHCQANLRGRGYFERGGSFEDRLPIQNLQRYVEMPLETSPTARSNLASQPGVLRFFTISVVFDVVLGQKTEGQNYVEKRFVLLDSLGYIVGDLVFASDHEDDQLRDTSQLLGRHKFILLSEALNRRSGYLYRESASGKREVGRDPFLFQDSPIKDARIEAGYISRTSTKVVMC